jgi:hypothetical protein
MLCQEAPQAPHTAQGRKAEAVAIAGEDYRVYHQVGLDGFCSIASQLADDFSGSCVGVAGIVSVVEK